MLNPDGTLPDNLVESFFDEAVLAMLRDPSINKLITTAQKRRIIEALDTVFTENDDVLSISMLFFTVTLSEGEDNPQLGISFDVNKLLEINNRLPKN